jgi:hypothetical protein
MNGNRSEKKILAFHQVFCLIRLMLRNKADRATRALLREISRDNVDLFSSFESTKSVPTRTSSIDSSVLGIILFKLPKFNN